MSHHDAWCEPGSFNLPTSLMKTCDYAKKLQESTDPCRYLMQIRPAGLCFMEGENVQGFAGSTRQAPPDLVDVETRLKRSPDAVITVVGPVRDKTPAPPPELQRVLTFRECDRSIGTTISHHRLRSQMPSYAPIRTDIVLDKRKQVDIAGRGRNTRQEMKDAFKKYNKNKFSSRADGIYVPSTALECASGSNMGCVHVAQTDPSAVPAALPSGTVSGSAGGAGLTASGSMPSGGPSASGPSLRPQKANQAGGGPSKETVQAAAAAGIGQPLWQVMNTLGQEAGRNLQFYGWKSPCAQH